MRILILGTAYPHRGGIAHYNALLYKHLSKNNEVRLISFKRQYPKIFFPGKTQEESGEAEIKVTAEPLMDSINPLNWIKVGLVARSWNADLIIFKYWLPFFAPCFGVITAIAKLFRNTKALIVCDNVIPHERRIGDKIFTRFAFSFANYFIVQSDTVENELLDFKPNAVYKKIPHPVYEIFGEKLSKAEAKNELKIKNEKVILFFGYIRKYKGVHDLIDAMKIFCQSSDAHLLIVGEYYDDENSYREQVRKLNLSEKISIVSDYVPSSEVAKYFSACDVVVLPYIDATQSGIIQIAYNFDKPVIATSVGGLKEVIVDNYSGLLVPPNNPNELANAMKKFYDENLEEKLSFGASQEKLNIVGQQ